MSSPRSVTSVKPKGCCARKGPERPSTPPGLAADFALVGRFQDGSAGQLPPTEALERLVCLRQVKELDVRMQREARRDAHEILAIGAREIGDRGNHPLAQKKLVWKAGNITHVNSSAYHSTALARRLERLRHQCPDGGKNERRVE